MMPRYIDLEDVGGVCYLLLAWETGERFTIRADTLVEPMELRDGEGTDNVMRMVW